MKQEDTEKLLETLFYQGDYVPQYNEIDTDTGEFNELNAYTGWPSWDNETSHLEVHTCGSFATVYLAYHARKKAYFEPLRMITEIFPMYSVKLIKLEIPNLLKQPSWFIEIRSKESKTKGS